MARDTRAAFLRALAEAEPRLADAFEAAMLDIRSTARRRQIEAAIRRGVETGDVARAVQEVMEAIELGPEFFAPLDRAIQQAFEDGGAYQIGTLPAAPVPGVGRLVVRFQGRHPRAEAWTRARSAALVTEIADDTRTVIRETVSEAVAESLPYRSVTRTLIGRTEGNRLAGGVIGLHSTQARAVRNAQAEIAALDSAVLRRKRLNGNDRRRLEKAIREGRPLPAADVEKIAGRYADRLLRLRGETIARTEGNKAMNAGRHEAIEQMIESGKVRAELVTKIWDATISKRTRESHLALNGQQVRWNAKFQSPVTGAYLRHPHDEDAPAAEVVNCRCTQRVRINWAGMAE